MAVAILLPLHSSSILSSFWKTEHWSMQTWPYIMLTTGTCYTCMGSAKTRNAFTHAPVLCNLRRRLQWLSGYLANHQMSLFHVSENEVALKSTILPGWHVLCWAGRVTIWQIGTHHLHQNQKSIDLYYTIIQDTVILKNHCHVTR